MPDSPIVPVIFLDDGGVLSDNAVRGPQWQRMVGEYLAPRLGGTPADWGLANREHVPGLFHHWERPLAPGETHADRNTTYLYAWLSVMCEAIGIATPPREEAVALAADTEAYVVARVRAAYPGAPEAVHALAAHGFTLHTASGETSIQLDGYLTGMGIRQHFGHLFGPDLVDCLKLGGPAYYERLLAVAGLDPRDTLFIDDNPDCLTWLADIGAATLLIGSEGTTHACAPSLADAAEQIIASYPR